MKKLNKKGFTIVELVIVIGVIGILSAILIPTFVNLTDQAQKTQIQSNLRNAYAAYIAEAVDGEIVLQDNVYVDDDANTETPRVTTKKIEILDLAEDKVTLKLDDKYYDFDADEGTWGEAAAASTMVVASNKYFDAATGGTDLALKYSTFNKVVVYAKA